jgi:mitochondrial cardiolipin hydrolase
MQDKPEIIFSPEDRIVDRIISECLSAGKTIDIVVFLIGSKSLSNALVKIHKKGVAIRIIIDSTVAKTRYSTDEFLMKNGIEVKTIKVKGGSMHSKFVLIDGVILVAGSANLTNDANYRNHEFAFISGDPELIQPFRSKFEEMWEMGKCTL